MIMIMTSINLINYIRKSDNVISIDTIVIIIIRIIIVKNNNINCYAVIIIVLHFKLFSIIPLLQLIQILC